MIAVKQSVSLRCIHHKEPTFPNHLPLQNSRGCEAERQSVRAMRPGDGCNCLQSTLHVPVLIHVRHNVPEFTAMEFGWRYLQGSVGCDSKEYETTQFQ